MQVERQALHALKWTALAKFLGQGITWTITLVVLRLLSPEDYGLMAITMVVISVAAGIAELGLSGSLIQARSVSSDELSRVAGALAVLTLSIALIVFLSAPLIAHIFENDDLTNVVRVSSLMFVFNAVDAVPQAIASRDMQFKWLAGVEFASAITSSLTTLALAWWGAGVWALVFGNLAGSALRTTLLVSRRTLVWPSLSLEGIRHHLHFGGTVTVNRFIWQLTIQADLLIAGRYLTPGTVGEYSVAVYLANLPMQKAMGIVNQVAFPAVARLQDELPRLRGRMLEALRLLGFATIPALWGISAVAPELVDVVLGSKWRPAVFPLQVVSLVAPMRMVANVLSTAMSAVGHANLDLCNTIVMAVLLPAGFLIGVHWGINGMAASWLISVPLAFAFNFPRIQRALGLSFKQIYHSMHAPLAAGIAMYAVVTGLRFALQGAPAMLVLPSLVACGGAVYLAMVFVVDRSVWTDVRRIVAALRG